MYEGRSTMYILGPCAAESREQVLTTAEQICSQLSAFRSQKSDFRFIYRAGAWKPRTSPNTFQGVGAEALKWLKEVKERFSLPIATEVATPEHVEAAIQAGVDYLWIGARTSANPIAVEKLSESIRNYRNNPNHPNHLKGILIKNPVNADAYLWLGNIERLERTGVSVIAVHRGCNHQPCWHMAHEVRLARPDIPMLLDPSHMSGDAAKVQELMGKVSELGLDGAMIEVHNNPECALSDSKQQIRPDEIGEILEVQLTNIQRISNLSLTVDPTKDGYTLAWLRAEIDELDERLWDTIAARMEVSERIGEWKKAHGVAPLQPERFNAILEKRKQWAAQKGLPEEFVEQLFEIIHEQSLREQI